MQDINLGIGVRVKILVEGNRIQGSRLNILKVQGDQYDQSQLVGDIPIRLSAICMSPVELPENVERGFIIPIQSPYASPVVLCRENNGLPLNNPEAYRFAVDYRKLNAITKYPRYPLPLIEDLIMSIPLATIMSSLDLRSGYIQLVNPSDVVKTAFVSKNGTYAFTCMPFGMSGAAPNFQKAIDIILKPVIGVICELQGFNLKNRKDISYPTIIRLAIRPVPHGPDLPIPSPPDTLDNILDHLDQISHISSDSDDGHDPGSRLKGRHLINSGVSFSWYRFREKEFVPFLRKKGLVFCNNVPAILEMFKIMYELEEWRLFIDSSKRSLKAVLHNGNRYASVPVGHSVHLKECYENLEFILNKLSYSDHK
ncbi:retrovirus-related Pol polyprotein from transposon gypsy [Trichonephila clavipes]|nr:retrovirus-related Pol polyprotein from transposon gypsy [Trichonephila clavipes]